MTETDEYICASAIVPLKMAFSATPSFEGT